VVKGNRASAFPTCLGCPGSFLCCRINRPRRQSPSASGRGGPRITPRSYSPAVFHPRAFTCGLASMQKAVAPSAPATKRRPISPTVSPPLAREADSANPSPPAACCPFFESTHQIPQGLGGAFPGQVLAECLSRPESSGPRLIGMQGHTPSMPGNTVRANQSDSAPQPLAPLAYMVGTSGARPQTGRATPRSPRVMPGAGECGSLRNHPASAVGVIRAGVAASRQAVEQFPRPLLVVGFVG
jgi:hypothetical protein